MLWFLHYNTELISVIWNIDGHMLLALYVALYFCFKKGFHRNLDLIWFNKIFLSKIVVFFGGKWIV